MLYRYPGRQVEERRLQCVEAVVQRQQRMPPERDNHCRNSVNTNLDEPFRYYRREVSSLSVRTEAHGQDRPDFHESEI